MSEKHIWNLLKNNKTYVGAFLAEEDKNYKMQKLDKEIMRLKKQQDTLQSTRIDPINTKYAVSKLQWSPSHQKKVLQKLKQDPNVTRKKSLVSLIEGILDGFI